MAIARSSSYKAVDALNIATTAAAAAHAQIFFQCQSAMMAGWWQAAASRIEQVSILCAHNDKRLSQQRRIGLK